MDKAEYKIKLDTLMRLAGTHNYQEAAAVADSIDWRRVKSIRTLCIVSEIYEASGSIETAEKILKLAYTRSSINKTVLYRLTKMCIKKGDFSEADRYCREFEEAAAGDSTKYLLRYKLLTAEKAPLSERIAELEKYKENEFSESGAIELAGLYKEAGSYEKCLDLCDEIIVWFAVGEAVDDARAIKEEVRGLLAEKQKEEAEAAAAIEAQQAFANEEIRKVGSSELHDQLASSIRNVIEGMNSEKNEEPEIAPEEEEMFISRIDTDPSEIKELEPETITHVDSELLQGVSSENVSKISDYSGAGANVKSDDNIDDLLSSLTESLAKEVASGKYEKIDEKMDGGAYDRLTAKETDESLGLTRNVVIDEEILKNYIEHDKAVHETAKANTLRQAGVIIDKTEIPEADAAAEGEIPAEASTQEPVIRGSASQEISFEEAADPEPEAADRIDANQDTAGLEAEVSADTYQDAAESEDEASADAYQDTADLETEVWVESTQETASQEKAVQETSAQAEPAQEAAAEEPAIQADENDLPSKAGELNEEALIPDENSVNADEDLEGIPQKNPEEGVSNNAAEDADSIDASYISLDDAAPVNVAEKLERAAAVSSKRDEMEFPELEKFLQETIEKEAPEKTDADEPDAEEIELFNAEFPEDVKEEKIDPLIFNIMAEPEKIDIRPLEPREFDEVEKEIFSYFAKIPGISQQVTVALNDLHNNSGSRTSQSGNLAIIGRKGSGKSRVADAVIVSLCRDLGIDAVKKARISAVDLNKKSAAEVVAKMTGGFLIIEDIGNLNDLVVQELNKAMEFNTGGLVIIAEDEKPDMQALFKRFPEFEKKFTSTIVIPVFTNDELVSFAKTYASENGYRMDEMATLALYTIIGDNQSATEPVTVGHVKEIMDNAINKCGSGARGFGRKLSKKSIDTDGKIIMREKDFEY